MVQKMQTQMAQIIQDVTQQHPRWINQYDLITFNDKDLIQPLTTDDPAVFLQGFNDFAKRNAYNTTRVRFVLKITVYFWRKPVTRDDL